MGQNTWADISPEKINEWLTGTRKYVQHQSGKYKL